MKLKSKYGFVYNTKRKIYSFTKVFSGGDTIIPYKEEVQSPQGGFGELEIDEAETYGEKVSNLLCFLFIGDVGNVSDAIEISNH